MKTITLTKKELIILRMIDNSIMELDDDKTFAFSIRLKMSLLPGNTFFKKMVSLERILKVVKSMFECELLAYNDADAHKRAPMTIDCNHTHNDERLNFVLKKIDVSMKRNLLRQKKHLRLNDLAHSQ